MRRHKKYLARAARRKFLNARLGHPFSLVSAACTAEKILILQPGHAQRREILQRLFGSPVFSGIWRAQRGENFATLDGVSIFLWYLARAARRKILQRLIGSPVFSGIWRAQRGEIFTTIDWVTRFLWYLARACSAEKILQR